MGLDITYYRRLKPAPDVELDSHGHPISDGFFRAHAASLEFTEQNWPGRTNGLEADAVYSFDDSDGFRAGSYGGYGEWRKWLASLGGYRPEDAWDGRVSDAPFLELVNFSDCEGYIGAEVAKKLAKDFAEHESKIGDGYNADKYREWRTAFETAADGGCVEFH